MGRLTAVFIIGPILTYKGLNYEDNLLTLIGILLIIWDGIKVGCQLCKNKNNKTCCRITLLILGKYILNNSGSPDWFLITSVTVR